MKIQNILVVCVGNICRSPMGEFFFKQECPQLNISSAGISGMIGHSADEKAITCMDRLNIDMRSHIAQKLNEQHIKNSDLILVMSNRQLRHIEQTWPFAKGKVFRLGHWQNTDIADPYQHDQQFFDNTCRLIQTCVQDWKKHI